MSNYRPSKRPSVKDVSKWHVEFEDYIEADWLDKAKEVMVETGYPYPDFYRVTYAIDGVKKSKLFYGESAYHNMVRFVGDLGFRSIYYSHF